MRLISQDRMIDVPYEYGSLSVGVGKYEDVEVAFIKYRNASSPIGTKLAEYSSKAKAIKVMRILRTIYSQTQILKVTYQIGLLANLEEQFGFDKTQDMLTGVFQFPTDEEVEV